MVISRSSSIQRIGFMSCYVEGPVLNIFHTRSMKKVHFTRCTITRQAVETMQTANLQHVELVHNSYGHYSEAPGLEHDFVLSLNKNHTVEFIRLDDGINGYRALDEVLVNPNSILSELTLESGCNDEKLFWLWNGLASNRSLHKLVLSSESITERGWRVVSAVLTSPITVLKELQIFFSGISDESAAILALGILSNRTMETLEFGIIESISAEGWRSLVRSMQGCHMRLKCIRLPSNDTIDDSVASILADALVAKRESLEEFDISDCDAITADGWNTLATTFQASMPNLRTLTIGNNNFNDDVTIGLVDGLCRQPLEMLNLNGALSRSGSVSIASWRAIAQLLTSNTTCLRKLSLDIDDLRGGNSIVRSIDDEVVIVLADALANNKTLTELRLGSEHTISLAGWVTFSRVLLDTSSVNATYMSNHTLCCIAGWDVDDNDNRPDHLRNLLDMNTSENKSEVARLKILQNHFISDVINIQSVMGTEPVKIQTKLVPSVLSWLGKDYEGHTALYKFLRSMPSLLETARSA